MKLIVKMLAGSHLYGTSTPASDLDYKGVYIPTAEDILLQRVRGSVGHKKKKFGQKNESEDTDQEYFSLQQFLTLVAEGQTIGIDMIFSPDSVLTEVTPLWRHIQENKYRLLNRNSSAFVGYCNAQAEKYSVKGERLAAARAAMELFEAEWKVLGTKGKVRDVPRERLEALCQQHEFCELMELPVGRTEKLDWFLKVCGRKACFTSGVKHTYDMYKGVVDSYGKRAEQAENSEGIDWKALSHAVRVATEAIELMTTSKVTFPLPNAAHVLDVKLGKIPYEEVTEEIEQLRQQVDAATAVSVLPESSDTEWINDLVMETYTDEVLRGKTDG